MKTIIQEGFEMNQYITGTAIRNLREQRKMTQLQLAEILKVSDKTVSKWETAKGYPDITLLEPIADALGISVPELISGNQAWVRRSFTATGFSFCLRRGHRRMKST